ncbi:ornithine cyclodeaminase family protein [Clostridiaceae bacterium 35-E11]
MTEVLLISQQDIKSALDMEKTIEVLEKVYRAHGNNQVNMPSKITLDLGESNDWPLYGGSYNAMPAYIGEDLDVAGIKWVWGFEDNPKKGLPYIGGTILLNDPRTGEQLAIMDGSYITDIRTGASAGVAAKYLAKKGAQVVSIIGAGVVGRMSLIAISKVLDIKKAFVADIRSEASERFASEMSTLLGIDVIAANSNKEAVEDADVIVTATIANEALVMKDWLKEGSLVITLGSFQELDENIPLSTDKLIVDSWAQNSHRGELLKLVHAGKITETDVYAELPEIIVEKKVGRESDKEKICASIIGMGSTDIGVAGTLYKQLSKKLETKFNMR